MALSAQVTSAQPGLTVKQVMTEWLNSYFDGSDHTVAGASYTFPECDVKADYVRPRGQPANPIIGFRASEDGVEDEFWRDGGGLLQETGFAVAFYVLTTHGTSDESSEGSARRQRDEIDGLLRLLLVRDRKTLAAAGLLRSRMLNADPIEIPDDAPDHYCIMRVVNFSTDIEYDA